ncbi:unnamed protein product [Trifolium pratense]|uniref:Uncharacterized protein n=1 Tax=Trifolium pratense TaxID=57577 RepID=A0ACB0KZQ5_TRIPR|nr:unnamed protein product [Trifolium pratense]
MSASTSTSTNPITKIPPFIFKNLEIVGNEMEFSESLLTLLPEKMVDFESLKANGFDVKPYFIAQGWDNKSQRRTTIVHPRLLSDLLFQGGIIKNLQKFYPELVANKVLPDVLSASFLTKMHLINSKVVQPSQEFEVRLEDRLYVDGYPVISELDCEERKSKRKAETQEEQVKLDLLTQKKIKVEQAVVEQRTKKKHEAPAEKVAEESSRAPKRKMMLDDDEDDSEETHTDEKLLLIG